MAGTDSIEYAQSLARLFEVFESTATGAAPREAAAREVENRSRRRSISFEIDGSVLRLDSDEALSFDEEGIESLVTALLKHQVGRISIRQLTPARDLMEVATLLTATTLDPEGGLAAEEAAASMRLWNVEIVGTASLDDHPVDAGLPRELLAALHDDAEEAAAEAALRSLAASAEQALESGDARTVGGVLVALDAFERFSLHDNLRDACADAIKRLLSPMALKLTAQLLPSARRRTSLLSVLSRSEDAGAEALFTHLVASQSMHERRSFFDALIELRAGIPMLVAALDDPQWYVARNAAELLGEMRVEGAERQLMRMLRSKDERRRVAAASALARLRTPDALAALNSSGSDVSPQVRYFAKSALMARMDGATARVLGEALEQHGDGDVKLQIIAALGRLGTPDAVQKLIKQLTSPTPTRGPVDHSSDFRCASLEAVAEARGASALTIVSQFRRDRDPRVRETAERVFARLAG